MRRPLTLAAAAILLVALCGCSQRSATPGGAETTAQSPAATAVPAVSRYDSGPRAGATPANEELAEQGGKLFQTKGCSACHTFGKKMSGPDLQGVTVRRTALWMENQILHPEVMTKEDPISKKLLGEMMLQMPNQGLKPEEARAVIEFLKHKDREAGLKPAGGAGTQ